MFENNDRVFLYEYTKWLDITEPAEWNGDYKNTKYRCILDKLSEFCSLWYLGEQKYIYSQHQPLKIKFKLWLFMFRKIIHNVHNILKLNLTYKIRKLAPYIWCW